MLDPAILASFHSNFEKDAAISFGLKSKPGKVIPRPFMQMGEDPAKKKLNAIQTAMKTGGAPPWAGAALGTGVGAVGGALSARRGQHTERMLDSLMHATGAMDKKTLKKRQKGRRRRVLVRGAVGGLLGAGAGHGLQKAAPTIKKHLSAGLKPHLDKAEEDIKKRVGNVAEAATAGAARGVPKGAEEGAVEAGHKSLSRIKGALGRGYKNIVDKTMNPRFRSSTPGYQAAKRLAGDS